MVEMGAPSRLQRDTPDIKEADTSAELTAAGEQELRSTTSGPSSMLSADSVDGTDGNARTSPSLGAQRAEAHTGHSLDALDGSTVAVDCEESVAKLSAKDKADTGLSEGMLRKNCADEPPSSTGAVPGKIDYTQEEEAKLAIQKCNEMGLGEDISFEEFHAFLQKLPCKPHVDTSSRLNNEQRRKLLYLHALYRFRYYKHKLSQTDLQNDKLIDEDKDVYYTEEEEEGDEDFTNDDDDEGEEEYGEEEYGFPLKEDIRHISEEDCSETFIQKHGFFKYLEEDGILDWCFDPDFFGLAALTDYNRLVPQNYGGCEYVRWDEYRKYFDSYETGLEYLKYCQELSKHLKWMEDFLLIEQPSLKWGCISTRGAYQAVKIATDFSKITDGLAYIGYYECTESMSYDVCWFKELDGVYFEIWKRVNSESMSFEGALRDIYALNKFPLRQHRIECALKFSETMEEMEAEFLACTTDITKEVIVEDKVQELMAVAVKNLVKKPKFYEDYIKKKMDIARVIGLPEFIIPNIEAIV